MFKNYLQMCAHMYTHSVYMCKIYVLKYELYHKTVLYYIIYNKY